MEAIKRKPFQGILQILQFNWHFYLIAISVLALLLFLTGRIPNSFHQLIYSVIIIVTITIFSSMVVSWYVYDFSGLYNLNWLSKKIMYQPRVIFNIHAGFDESSILLKQQFPGSQLRVFDFYDPLKHREISIRRARKKYPPFNGTVKVNTTGFPLQTIPADLICLFLSAHEIRNEKERIDFFMLLKKNLAMHGEIVVVEHLRDLPNFLAYTIGFFHFHSASAWKKCFDAAGLCIVRHHRFTRFISVYYLQKNDTTP